MMHVAETIISRDLHWSGGGRATAFPSLFPRLEKNPGGCCCSCLGIRTRLHVTETVWRQTRNSVSIFLSPADEQKRGTRDSVSIFLSPADEKNVVVVVELAWGLSRRTIAISLFRVWSDLVSILRRQTVTFADKTSGSQNHRPLETPSPP